MYVVLIHSFSHVDIAPVNSKGYMGRPATPGAAEYIGERGYQRPNYATLLEDVRSRCELMLTGVSERQWNDL